MLADENPGVVPLLRAVRISPGESVALLIGPEGGWIDAERSRLAESGWTPASLGPLVLRAETAVCAALAVVNQMVLAANATK